MRSQGGAQDVRRRNGRASHAHHPNHRHSRASAHGRRLSQHSARRECRRQGLMGRASAALPEGDLLGAEEIPALKRGALAFVFRPSRRERRNAFAPALVMFCAVGARSSTASKSSNHDVTGAFEIAPPTLRNNRFFNKKKPRHHSDAEALGSGRDAGKTVSASERDRRSRMFGSFLRSRRSGRSGISPSRIRPRRRRRPLRS